MRFNSLDDIKHYVYNTYLGSNSLVFFQILYVNIKIENITGKKEIVLANVNKRQRKFRKSKIKRTKGYEKSGRKIKR